jgi:uncharacterized protein YpmB
VRILILENDRGHDDDLDLPTILETPEKRKKRFLSQITIGVIVLIIGSIVLVFGLYPMLNSQDAKTFNDDFDKISRRYKSYNTGDKIYISGKITEKQDATKTYENTYKNFPGTGSRYLYIIDEELKVYSNDNQGDVGDEVTIECEINELNLPYSQEHFLKGLGFHNLFIYLVIGIMIVVFGSAIISFSYRKLKRSLSEKAVSAHEVATKYKSLENIDDEDLMYQTLRSKKKN